MDPKMDSGFMMPEKDAVVDDFDPMTPMLPEEILGIMDQLLCYEVRWKCVVNCCSQAHDQTIDVMA